MLLLLPSVLAGCIGPSGEPMAVLSSAVVTGSAPLDVGFDLGAVRFEDLLSTAGFELGINAAGIIVRLDFVWKLSEDFTWIPGFDFGFGQMF